MLADIHAYSGTSREIVRLPPERQQDWYLAIHSREGAGGFVIKRTMMSPKLHLEHAGDPILTVGVHSGVGSHPDMPDIAAVDPATAFSVLERWFCDEVKRYHFSFEGLHEIREMRIWTDDDDFACGAEAGSCDVRIEQMMILEGTKPPEPPALCALVNCPPGQVCRNLSLMCLPDPCEGVVCPAGEVCSVVDGQCHPSHGLIDFSHNARVRLEGTVVFLPERFIRPGQNNRLLAHELGHTWRQNRLPDEYQEMGPPTPPGQCIFVFCPAPLICRDASLECLPDPCDGVVCPGRQVCSVVDGNCHPPRFTPSRCGHSVMSQTRYRTLCTDSNHGLSHDPAATAVPMDGPSMWRRANSHGLRRRPYDGVQTEHAVMPHTLDAYESVAHPFGGTIRIRRVNYEGQETVTCP